MNLDKIIIKGNCTHCGKIVKIQLSRDEYQGFIEVSEDLGEPIFCCDDCEEKDYGFEVEK